jgi:hypothetical protein
LRLVEKAIAGSEPFCTSFCLSLMDHPICSDLDATITRFGALKRKVTR